MISGEAIYLKQRLGSAKYPRKHFTIKNWDRFNEGVYSKCKSLRNMPGYSWWTVWKSFTVCWWIKERRGFKQ